MSGGATDTEQKRRESAIVRSGRFAALGFEFAGIVVAGVVAGYYLDGWLHTAPLFTLSLSLAGMGGALYRLLWMLRRFNSQSDNGG